MVLHFKLIYICELISLQAPTTKGTSAEQAFTSFVMAQKRFNEAQHELQEKHMDLIRAIVTSRKPIQGREDDVVRGERA